MQPHERNCPGRRKHSKETPLPLLLARILLTLWPQEMGISSGVSHWGKERVGLEYQLEEALVSWKKKKNTHDSADFPERLSGQTAAETRLGH